MLIAILVCLLGLLLLACHVSSASSDAGRRARGRRAGAY